MVSVQHVDSVADGQHRDDTSKRAQQVLSQGPWNGMGDPMSTQATLALPMPVEIAAIATLEPFFQHLYRGGSHFLSAASDEHAVSGHEPGYGTDLLEFPKGVLYSDGRLDLCKMVVGPTSIQALMDSLRLNTFVKHFLLGNNIIGAVGARAIADFVKAFPQRIGTWYLAGNCINANNLKLLVDSWAESELITNIWLKRNPLGNEAAQDLAQLVQQSPNLRTLDLDQTGLGDHGVGELFAALNGSADRPVSLRHIYLNATGISKHACQEISRFLTSPACALESLYMSCNPIGDAVSLLAPGLKSNSTLQRLALSSCGLKSATLAPVIEAVCGHRSLRVLDIGQAYATEDLGAHYNWLTDESVPQLVFLLQTTQLRYLELGEVAMSPQGLRQLLDAVSSSSLLFFNARPVYPAKRADAALQRHAQARLEANVLAEHDCSYQDFMRKHKRFVVSPADVRLIDSVYRNRDVSLARRGLKILDKHWQDGDDTALRAELGQL